MAVNKNDDVTLCTVKRKGYVVLKSFIGSLDIAGALRVY